MCGLSDEIPGFFDQKHIQKELINNFVWPLLLFNHVFASFIKRNRGPFRYDFNIGLCCLIITFSIIIIALQKCSNIW